MKSSLRVLFLCLLCCPGIANAQPSAAPSYYNVLQNFINHYDPELDRYANLSFAKKPDGWYVQVLEVEALTADPTRQYSKEYLYWSNAASRYRPLSAFSRGVVSEEEAATFWKNASANWYHLNRILYYGYDGWDIDVIRALEGKAGINDTMHESLARAYANYAHRFLWYQMGGAPLGSDPLQQKRPTLAPVPEAAADSAAAYIRKSVDQYRIIAAHNLGYPTIVGSVALKLNNELMSGWQFMLIAGYPGKAAPFLKDVRFDSSQIRIAKKLLDECLPNAILITYGDNDTYQPWYVQEALGYRKDISVINLSLLGTPEYLQWLKKTNGLDFSLTRETFAPQKGFYYVNIAAAADGEKRQVKSVRQFLDEVAHRIQTEDMRTETIAADSLFIPVNSSSQLWKGLYYRPARSISPAIKPHYYMSDLLLVDIVNANIGKRPICFISQEDALFMQHQLDYGMTYELIPAKKELVSEAISVKRIEAVLAQAADFMPHYYGADNQAQGNLIKLLTSHLALAAYYNAKGRNSRKEEHFNEAIRLVQQHRKTSGYSIYYVGYYLIYYNHNQKLGQELIEDYLQEKVAYIQTYGDALQPPEADNSEHFYTEARKLYETQKLSTERIAAIWETRPAR